MSTQLDEMGPVDFMVIEFPGGRMSGEGLPLLVDLADRGVVRVLDLVFVRKMSDGSIARMNLTGLSSDGLEDLELTQVHATEYRRICLDPFFLRFCIAAVRERDEKHHV